MSSILWELHVPFIVTTELTYEVNYFLGTSQLLLKVNRLRVELNFIGNFSGTFP